jgi:hypothetical protein
MAAAKLVYMAAVILNFLRWLPAWRSIRNGAFSVRWFH